EPDFYIDFKPFNDCSAYFTVFGDSMYPRYASGEIVAVKQVFNLDIIWWGEAYLVITDETADNMRTIKLMYPNEDNHDLVNLRASNPNYKGETKILKTSIIALFLVKGKITRNLM
ncbi:MAG TPA: DNA-binding protein, partial [Spirochaetia bacterium]|nr:DNA-binding protein [Spirochaetia bacterium]